MNNKDILYAINEIDERYIEEASPSSKKKTNLKKIIRWAVPSACAATAIAFGAIFGIFHPPITTDYDGDYAPITPGGHVTLNGQEIARPSGSESTVDQPEYATSSADTPQSNTSYTGEEAVSQSGAEATSTTSSTEMFEIQPWEELSDIQRYTTLIFEEKTYYPGRIEINGAGIDYPLGEITLSGYDELNDTYHHKKSTAYKINGISTECAVAVELEEAVYAYLNSYYKPETLGDFIEDLNLHKTLELGRATDQDSYISGGTGGGFTQYDVPDSAVWDMLLCHTDAKAVDNYDSMWFITKMSIRVDIPLLGYSNIFMGVTEDGYLITNILDTGKGFFIGVRQCKEFIDYVKTNCPKEEVYYSLPSAEVPETVIEPEIGAASEAIASSY